jgi:hypothetical protein
LQGSGADGSFTFTQDVVLARKGEDVITQQVRGQAVTRSGIVTMCGKKFYEDLDAVLARRRLDTTVPLGIYNSYHRKGSAFSAGGVGFLSPRIPRSEGAVRRHG